MNKADLVQKVAVDGALTTAKSEVALAALVNGVKDALEGGEKVTLIGFGTFSVIDKKARKGKHPQTGKLIEIPATKSVKFKAGKDLKELIN